MSAWPSRECWRGPGGGCGTSQLWDRGPVSESISGPERQMGPGAPMGQASLAFLWEGRDFQEHTTRFWRTEILKEKGSEGRKQGPCWGCHQPGQLSLAYQSRDGHFVLPSKLASDGFSRFLCFFWGDASSLLCPHTLSCSQLRKVALFFPGKAFEGATYLVDVPSVGHGDEKGGGKNSLLPCIAKPEHRRTVICHRRKPGGGGWERV